MTNIRLKIETRGNKIFSDGKQRVNIRLYIGYPSTRYLIPGVEFLPEHWDKNSRRIKKKAPHSIGMNQIISKFENKGWNIIHEYINKDKILTFEAFRRELYNEGYNTDFFDYAFNYIESYSNKGTQKGMKNSMTKFKSFVNRSISFGEITVKLLEDYKHYCKNKGNNDNTTDKSLKHIKTILNAAITEGFITENPVNKFRFKEHEGRKDGLSSEAFKLLHRYFMTKEMTYKQKEGLRAYLFACCCGLRWSDIRKLKYKDINSNGIHVVEQKTNKTRNAPLISKARDYYMDYNRKLSEEQRIFDLAESSSPTNRMLQMIAEEINKKEGAIIIPPTIHFHSSRATFDETILNLTGSAEIAGAMTGHSVKVVLNHYGKINQNTINKTIADMEEIFFNE